MKKSITALAVIVILLLVSVCPAFAEPYNYSFTFTPPFGGSMRWVYPNQYVSGSTPYVDPNGSSAETNYFLTTDYGEIVLATYLLCRVDTTSRRYFTYQQGYGGLNQDYCFAGYPSNVDFNYYQISGIWLP